MGRIYVNAEAVLPKAILDQVRAVVGERSTCLWIPSRRSLDLDRRNQRIADLRAEGWTAQRIGSLLGITERTVRRVLGRKRAPAAPSATPPHGKPRQPSNPEVTHAR